MSGRLLLLGTPGLEVAGGRVDLFADRPTSHRLYLAARGGWVGRGEIALLYQPDRDGSARPHLLSSVRACAASCSPSSPC